RGAEASGSRVAFPGDPKRPGTHGGPAPSRVRRDRALGQALPARGGAVRIRREYAIACDPVRALRVDGSRAGCGVAHVRLRSCGRGRAQPGDCDSIKARRLRTRRPRIVTADERFFAIRLGALRVSSEHWTELEREVMTDHRWWSQGELRSATEQVWPEDLADLLIKAGIWGAD